ncbi:MAG: recombination regulator RecX, partial [Actinomycetota bacterium]|nr:recombination regulator RecX [Actinomycetota bacterium]
MPHERGRGRPGKRKDVHERALGLLAVRQRSRREIERRLERAGFEPEEIRGELDRLQQVGLIDDEAFA